MLAYKIDPKGYAGAVVIALSPRSLPVALEIQRWLGSPVAVTAGEPVQVARRSVILVEDVISDAAAAVFVADGFIDQGASRIVLAAPVATQEVMSVAREFFDETLFLVELDSSKLPEQYFTVVSGRTAA